MIFGEIPRSVPAIIAAGKTESGGRGNPWGDRAGPVTDGSAMMHDGQGQPHATPLEQFRQGLEGSDCVARLRAGLIGDGATIEGPFGRKPLVYADYVASGRALKQVEEFVAGHVLPFYANTHTEESFCGAYSTGLREAARATIARLTGAGEDCSVLFTGAGATAGLNRIVNLLDIPAQVRAGGRVRVLVGPYEHHSNLLPWRESGAEVIEVPEAGGGGPDMAALEEMLRGAAGCGMVVGAFSAASNVTGIITDTDAVTALLKRHGALAIWDYACAAPYLPMAMAPRPDCRKDAIVFSAHKFPGGPGASGATVLRDSVVRRTTPTQPGGGRSATSRPGRMPTAPTSATARRPARRTSSATSARRWSC